ncbi:glucose-6-phosphate dehydrogenase [Tumebacillus flagellatus]|uniref:Glucose-6-phosphate 1-dehydrogenase n=1 Tax=Tumebacillus flagellatus TaxID=1157490 RepID=A0A074LLN5_9BACL|nr:glucose-6-phosphate dehydrogenase [Tumebacillus flagellatus]KEO83016.1 glucose-6-phosphate dehydrogenase [Tumebacillus flagellatus]
MRESKQPFVMVLFGATGDLAKRKLFPALYALVRDGLIHEQFAVVGVGRSEMDTADFRQMVQEAIRENSRLSIQEGQQWQNFINSIDYVAIDVTKSDTYGKLKTVVDGREKLMDGSSNRLFYLSLAPELFGTVATNLRLGGLTQNQGWKRLIIEKPFGKDLESAQALNEVISQSFKEEEVYRIDHYLGKEMVQNIEILRFTNMLFEPVWNNRYIDNVQITASETLGVEDRASYYEHSGALRDMVQNHMLQMLMMVCMEPPSKFETEAIRDEKVKVLRSLRRYGEDEVSQYVVRGQYSAGQMKNQPVLGYRDEPNVAPDSDTETFVAAKLFVNNFRWSGVPFFIRTGKRMPKKTTEIVIQFKEVPTLNNFHHGGNIGPNLLVININPSEGMTLYLNAKKPGTDDEVVTIAMDFCNNCEIEGGSPEAYERLINDAIHGDSTFFTRWDEVSLAWKFVDPIRRAWDKNLVPLHEYQAGTWGPKAVNYLLSEDNTQWWYVNEKEAFTLPAQMQDGVFSRR